jgi:hypothetical protein
VKTTRNAAIWGLKLIRQRGDWSTNKQLVRGHVAIQLDIPVSGTS